MDPYYQDDGIWIFHGDCREVAWWKFADVLVTDPPYGLSHTTQRRGSAPWRGQVAIDGDGDTSLRDWVLDWWRGQNRPALVFGTWKRPPPPGTVAQLTWDKGLAAGMGDLSIPWKPNTEEIYVLGSGFAGHRGSSVLSYPMVGQQSFGRTHPNEKPVELMRDLIGKCPPGMVADPFMGSGSTLRAAKDLGRRAVGIEREERYCEIAARRLAQEVLDLGA